MKNFLLETAALYRKSGLSVLSIRLDGKQNKQPAGAWKHLQTAIMTDEEFSQRFTPSTHGVGIITGYGNVVCLDFDYDAATIYTAWQGQVNNPDLLAKLCVSKTHKGFHVWYRTAEAPGKSCVLAQRADGKFLIEFKAQGRYCVDAPTPGYEVQQGSITDMPTLTPKEHTALLEAARSFDKRPDAERQRDQRPPFTAGAGENDPQKPIGDYNSKATLETISALLEGAGWTYEGEQELGQLWLRPQYDGSNAYSAVLFINEDSDDPPIFRVYSTNAAPFEAEKSYSPFQVYCLTKHGSLDSARVRKAVKELSAQGVGKSDANGAATENYLLDIDAIFRMAEEIKFKPFLIDEILQVGEVNLIVGDSGQGKSPFVIQMALCVASGKPFLGLRSQRGVVLIVDYENGIGNIGSVIERQMRLLGIEREDLREYFHYLSMNSANVKDSIINKIKELKPVLTVIDSMGSVFPDFDEKSGNANRLIRDLKTVLSSFGGSLIGLHHTRKADYLRPVNYETDNLMEILNTARGSKAVVNSTDLRGVFVDLSNDDQNRIILRSMRRLQGELPSFEMERIFDAETGEPLGYAPVKKTKQDLPFQMEYHRLSPEFQRKDLERVIANPNNRRISKIISAWLRGRFVEQPRYGWYRKLESA